MKNGSGGGKVRNISFNSNIIHFGTNQYLACKLFLFCQRNVCRFFYHFCGKKAMVRLPLMRSLLARAQVVRSIAVSTPTGCADSAPSLAMSAILSSWVNTSSSLRRWKFRRRSSTKNCNHIQGVL